MLQVLHELWDFVMGVEHSCPADTFLVPVLTLEQVSRARMSVMHFWF